jgi:hypothetical protein
MEKRNLPRLVVLVLLLLASGIGFFAGHKTSSTVVKHTYSKPVIIHRYTTLRDTVKQKEITPPHVVYIYLKDSAKRVRAEHKTIIEGVIKRGDSLTVQTIDTSGIERESTYPLEPQNPFTIADTGSVEIQQVPEKPAAKKPKRVAWFLAGMAAAAIVTLFTHH